MGRFSEKRSALKQRKHGGGIRNSEYQEMRGTYAQ